MRGPLRVSRACDLDGFDWPWNALWLDTTLDQLVVLLVGTYPHDREVPAAHGMTHRAHPHLLARRRGDQQIRSGLDLHDVIVRLCQDLPQGLSLARLLMAGAYGRLSR